MNIKAIHSGVRAVGRLYLPGDEKELQAVLTDEAMESLASSGSISVKEAPEPESKPKKAEDGKAAETEKTEDRPKGKTKK